MKRILGVLLVSGLCAFGQVNRVPVAPDVADLSRQALASHLQGRLSEAESAYQKAIKADGDFSPAHNNLGALYYAQRKFSDAENEFRKAAERSAQNIIVRENLRAARYARDNSRPARERADELAKERPSLIQADSGEYLKILSLLPQKTIEEALDHERKGDTFSARKAYEDAAIEYRRSIAIDKYNPSVMNRLGVAYHQLQKLKEAEQQYREALRQNPYFLEALNNLGVAEFTKKNFDGALDQYNKALKLFPKSALTLQNIGMCYYAMERPEDGALALEQALTIDPNLFVRQSGSAAAVLQMSAQGNILMNFQLARIFAGQGDADQAISYLYKAAEAGLKDVKKVRSEPAFKTLLLDERFNRLLQTMQGGPDA